MDNLNIVLVLSLLTLGFLSSWFAAIKDNDNAIQLSLSSLTLAVVFALDNVIPLLYSYMRMHFPLSISLILTGFAVLGVVLYSSLMQTYARLKTV
ncbi:hypothetical protein OAA_18490 [Vibrio cyclitrophicus 1F175]|uniref:hypothetical protein n=1 Tax=Vibrio cyclitrophicus TaxID=47951 RepID=UPI00035D5D18|nr:hypothetical protein [Vibrio cyclitrophicus]OEF62194.1 hypothetical protein OAA_18490 [Vibrio cyclitrophicus 1F175]